MRLSSIALIAASVIGVTAAAHASVTWDWSWSGADFSGSGTLTTGPLSSGSYPITGISGTFNGQTITALDGSYQAPDNTLYVPGNNGEGDDNVLSYEGVAFDTSDHQIDIYDNIGNNGQYLVESTYSNGNAGEDAGAFSATEVGPVPEPVNVALAGFGLILVVGNAGRHFLSRRGPKRVP